MNRKLHHKDFSDELKNEAVRLITEQEYSCSEVCRRLGVNHNHISCWLRDYRGQPDTSPTNLVSNGETEDEINRLRKENKRLLMECEILKSAFLTKETNCDSI